MAMNKLGAVRTVKNDPNARPAHGQRHQRRHRKRSRSPAGSWCVGIMLGLAEMVLQRVETRRSARRQ